MATFVAKLGSAIAKAGKALKKIGKAAKVARKAKGAVTGQKKKKGAGGKVILVASLTVVFISAYVVAAAFAPFQALADFLRGLFDLEQGQKRTIYAQIQKVNDLTDEELDYLVELGVEPEVLEIIFKEEYNSFYAFSNEFDIPYAVKVDGDWTWEYGKKDGNYVTVAYDLQNYTYDYRIPWQFVLALSATDGYDPSQGIVEKLNVTKASVNKVCNVFDTRIEFATPYYRPYGVSTDVENEKYKYAPNEYSLEVPASAVKRNNKQMYGDTVVLQDGDVVNAALIDEQYLYVTNGTKSKDEYGRDTEELMKYPVLLLDSVTTYMYEFTNFRYVYHYNAYTGISSFEFKSVDKTIKTERFLNELKNATGIDFANDDSMQDMLIQFCSILPYSDDVVKDLSLAFGLSDTGGRYNEFAGLNMDQAIGNGQIESALASFYNIGETYPGKLFVYNDRYRASGLCWNYTSTDKYIEFSNDEDIDDYIVKTEYGLKGVRLAAKIRYAVAINATGSYETSLRGRDWYMQNMLRNSTIQQINQKSGPYGLMYTYKDVVTLAKLFRECGLCYTASNVDENGWYNPNEGILTGQVYSGTFTSFAHIYPYESAGIPYAWGAPITSTTADGDRFGLSSASYVWYVINNTLKFIPNGKVDDDSYPTLRSVWQAKSSEATTVGHAGTVRVGTVAFIKNPNIYDDEPDNLCAICVGEYKDEFGNRAYIFLSNMPSSKSPYGRSGVHLTYMPRNGAEMVVPGCVRQDYAFFANYENAPDSLQLGSAPYQNRYSWQLYDSNGSIPSSMWR